MNRNTGIAAAIIIIAGLAMFGILWTLPQADSYLPQEKRLPATETAALP